MPRQAGPQADLKSRLDLPALPDAALPSNRTLMTTEKIDNISVTTQANVYFDGKCISHGILLSDGTKKSVGVILPASLTFSTGAAEIMECVGGGCEYKLAGAEAWATSSVGESFSVPAHSKFEIRVAPGFEAYHYICHFA
jgi:purine/pyrimidine-nucleoside phosphorylase